jgi:hypothetical protein
LEKLESKKKNIERQIELTQQKLQRQEWKLEEIEIQVTILKAKESSKELEEAEIED